MNKLEIYYNAFREISRMVHASTDLDEVLDLIVWKASEALKAKGALLRILNLETMKFELNSSFGLSEEYLAKGPATEEKLVTELYQGNRVIIIDDILHDPRIQYPQETAAGGFQRVLDAPLKFRDQIAGILRLFFDTPRQFQKEEIQFLESLAAQCACAIEKGRYIEDQRHKYDQLALQTEKLSALGRMAAGVAHEINNPLAAILLYTSNMYKKAPEDGPFKEGLSVILRETKRCKGIIQGLLEFSRAKEPNKTMVNVNAIIERSIGILGNELRLRHIEIVKQLSATVPDSMLDENQMEQVFVNLLLNAAQALIEKGTITISSHVDPQERDLIIQVADTGPGIPTENLGKIFDPFFSTKESGTGLGLAVSYGIVKSHRGDVVVENLPDKGCRFTLRLPLLSEETQTDV